MNHKVIFEMTEKDLDEVLTQKLTDIQRGSILNRFRDRMVSVDAVAEIHDVHRDTVIRYAKAGLIPHQKKGKLYKFSLADALELDFHKLRTGR